MNTLNTNTLLLRDGASKQQSELNRLQESYVQVEERSIEDLITEAQKISKELRFFDDKNIAIASWESFLIEDPTAYFKATETGKALLQKEWAKELASYIEAPESFLNNTEKLQKIAQPHTVLFLTFLKLLNHIKSKINGLTQKHLDFYFRERLQLTPKESVPDVVNVLIGLAENVTSLQIEKGTIFLAGEDEDGNELEYISTEDTIINQAAIAALKSVFVDKQILTIEDAHLHFVETPDKGLSKMFEIALGKPNPGDSLPDFPEGIHSLTEVYEFLEEKKEAEAYVKEQLSLNIDDFKYIVEKHSETVNHAVADWQKSYDILENAYKTKVKELRKIALKEINAEKGFDFLIKEIYGYPSPGDHLPLYNNKNTTFKEVYDDLTTTNLELNTLAEVYITEELKLTIQDFIFIVQTSTNTTATVSDIATFYQILEKAERAYRNIAITSPIKEKKGKIYAAKDLQALAYSQFNEPQESKRFRTFGNAVSETKETLETAQVGFAISSPLLLLKEGHRKITLLLELNNNEGQLVEFEKLFENNVFNVLLSSETSWFQPSVFSFEIDTIIKTKAVGVEVAIARKTATSLRISFPDGYELEDKDIGNYILDTDGVLYEILGLGPDSTVGVTIIFAFNQTFEKTRLYTPEEVEINNFLKIIVALSEEEKPVTPFETNIENEITNAKEPTIALLVNQEIIKADDNELDVDLFEMLASIAILNVDLNVEVSEMKNTIIQNDDGILNIKKIIEPFGTEPEVTDSFYFTNEEISKKAIKDLEITTQWINQPKDFVAYYENYTTEEGDVVIKGDEEGKGNEDFKANLYVHDGLNELPIVNGVALFTTNNKIEIENIPNLLKENKPNYNYQQNNEIEISETEVIDWQRYFRLELDPLDFQHKRYNELITDQEFLEEGKKLKKPYEPKFKNFRIGYSASATNLLRENSTTATHKLFHIHPFGHKEIIANENIKLIPTYEDNGSLYIGIARLIPSQIVSILFQMASGSANPDIENPVLTWSYLKDNDWFVLDNNAIISDTTNGLLNTGIVRVQIPEDATLGGTLMPNELHWLKISAAEKIDGVSDTIAIKTQVISATLNSETIADSHYETPLKEESIKETLQFIPEIETILQPYTSSQGKPLEQGVHFNKRISERLRHKNRAINMWDYEHMILEKFPEIYKVKCLPSTKELGDVLITVIPDIRKSLPFNPFRPKVGSDVLNKIRAFIAHNSPAYANVMVKNPTYLNVSVRCTVKFNEGYDAIFYASKLNNEIKEFLAPWAYGNIAAIKIGGTLKSGVLVNFIAERAYIDFVAKLKLFQSIDGQQFLDASILNNGEYVVIPSEPDMVIVSDEKHVIDVVNDNNYDEETQKGINYMMVERDFIIAKNTQL